MSKILDCAPMFSEEHQVKSLYPGGFAEVFLPPEGLIAFSEAFDTLLVRQIQLKLKLNANLEGGENFQEYADKIRKKLEELLQKVNRGEWTLKTVVPHLYDQLPHSKLDSQAIERFIKKSTAEILTEVSK